MFNDWFQCKERISSSLGRVDTILGKFNDDFSRLYPFMDSKEKREEARNEIDRKIRVDSSILRHLTVKYKKLDTKNEFFKKNNN